MEKIISLQIMSKPLPHGIMTSFAGIKQLKPGWQSSRMALWRCMEELGLAPTRGEQLIIDAHHNLRAFPKYKVSLSHSGKWGAALVSSHPEHLGVGIDIEQPEREFPSGAQKYIRHAQDDYLGSDLQKWCIKEACFKALWPLCEEPIYLTSIVIAQDKFGLTIGNQKMSGHYSLEKRKIESTELFCAQAFVTKKEKIS